MLTRDDTGRLYVARPCASSRFSVMPNVLWSTPPVATDAEMGFT
jgi:hypothetical protein